MKKYVAYLWAIGKARFLRRRVPIFVTLCVTNRCNIRCVYCYAEYYDRNTQEIPKERIFELIDELHRLGTKYISLNGGEALLRTDIAEIVDKIKSKGLLCHLSTNGLLIPSRIPVLRKIDSIAVSLDGIGERNDLNRGQGTYQRIMQGLECLKRENIKFHLHTVLTKNNTESIEELLSLAGRFGTRVQFSLLREEDSPDKSVSIPDDELKSLVKKIIALKEKGEPVFFSKESYSHYLRWPLESKQQIIWDRLPEGYRPFPCYIKRFGCHIEANGDVYPCVVLVNKYKPCNFLEVGFKKSWEHLSRNPCQACQNVCCNDLNLIFGLRVGSIYNATRIVLERFKKKLK